MKDVRVWVEQESTMLQRDSKMIDCYTRAARFIKESSPSSQLVPNAALYPFWIDDTGYFWYERHSVGAREFRLVNGEDGKNAIAFDHGKFASALEEASGGVADPRNLPITRVAVTLSPLLVSFSAFGKHWEYSVDDGECREVSVLSEDSRESSSADGKLIAFHEDYNLWLRDVETGEARAVTEDGVRHHEYANGHGIGGWPETRRDYGDICALWSPDGTRLLFYRMDRRAVKMTPFVDYVPKDGSLRPKLQPLKVAYPGDKEIETYDLYSYDLKTEKLVKAQYRPIPTTRKNGDGFFTYSQLASWSTDNRTAYFIDQDRYCKFVRVCSFDTQTGEVRELYEESSASYVVLGFEDSEAPTTHAFLKKTNELLWWTEQSGWGHLVLIDLDMGNVKNKITSGEWVVRRIIDVDEQRREVVIKTAGRSADIDPYYQDVCRVNIDTGMLTEVIGGNQDIVVSHVSSFRTKIARMLGTFRVHSKGVSPDGARIVITGSRVDQVPVHTLIDRDGEKIAEIEKADTSNLPDGWHWPEPYTVIAADGETDLYGVMFRPSHFSSEEKYPVINYIHCAPWFFQTPKSSFNAAGAYSDFHYYNCSALAELGFIVAILESRGTPQRSRVFRETSYPRIEDSANIEDHISALLQLGERFAFMDLNRAAVVSQSYPSGFVQFLKCQDFYKAGVVFGVHDYRVTMGPFHSDAFEGPGEAPSDRQFPEHLVNNLTTKLMVIGRASDGAQSYPPVSVYRVIDALQKANKDFEMLIEYGSTGIASQYAWRRAFDFLVRELTDNEPPREFDFSAV